MYFTLRGHETVSSGVQMSTSTRVFLPRSVLSTAVPTVLSRSVPFYTAVPLLFSYTLAIARRFIFRLSAGKYIVFPVTYTSIFNSAISIIYFFIDKRI